MYLHELHEMCLKARDCFECELGKYPMYKSGCARTQIASKMLWRENKEIILKDIDYISEEHKEILLSKYIEWRLIK